MYSVLIQNQKTIEYFHEFHPLFMEAVNKGKIGCCRWVESGTTVDTALPGLCDLIADKEEWRAIVVRVEDEQNMSEFATSPYNPYDFVDSDGQNDTVSESAIPLVRLSHMLGGIPRPEEDFIPDVRMEEFKAPVPYFRRDESEEAKAKRAKNEKAYEALLKKYAFDGKKPTNIIFVTFHSTAAREVREVAEKTWNNCLDVGRSEFWKKNKYPGNCRFLVYQYVKEGHVQKEADMFNFWTSLMVIAVNNIDPSTLQAYHLYKIRTEFNKEKMGEIFQNEIDELQGCKFYVDAEIKREIQRKMNEKSPMPIYRMNIPVVLDTPNNLEVNVDQREFRICPRSVNGDLSKWEGLQTGAEETLNAAFCRAERVLAESAEHMRFFSHMDEQEVVSLDRFQRQDMDNELSKTYDKIVQMQNTLSGNREKDMENVNERAKKVKKILSLRIDKPMALEIGLLMISLIIFACLPAFLFSSKYRVGRGEHILGIMVLIVVIFGIAELIILYFHKRKLASSIEAYNDAMEKNVELLTQDIEMFSNFVSNMVSHSRGKSYLSILKHKRFKTEIQYENLQQHIRAINIMLEKMKKWCTAFYLTPDFNRQQNENYGIETDIKPARNELYTFERQKEYSVPVNGTGDMLYSPFGFVEKLWIEREELFEDASSCD